MKVHAVKSWFARVGTVAAIGTVCGAIGGFGGYAALSYAAGQNLGGANDYQIPYQGILELGGQPVDGPTEFVFTLYTSKDSVNPADIVWTSNPRTLQVSRGYFSTVLGDETDQDNRLGPDVLAENVLYVGMNVDGVELAGRQRILAVPYAQNGSPGKTFVVDGKIQTVDLAVLGNGVVGGTLRVTGATTLSGSATVTGATTLNGATTVNNALTANSSTHLKSTLRLDGNVTTGGTADANKLVQFKYVGNSNTTSTFPLYADTGFSAADWNCAIGSFRIRGDINEDNAHNPLLEVKTEVSGSNWQVKVNMAHDSQGSSKGFEAGVICFNKKISNRTSWL